jgi:hypothetical protein
MPDNLPTNDDNNTTIVNTGTNRDLAIESIPTGGPGDRTAAGGDLASRLQSVPARVDMDTEMEVDEAASGLSNKGKGKMVGSLTGSMTPSLSSIVKPPSTLPEMILPTPSTSKLKPSNSTSASAFLPPATTNSTSIDPPLPIDHRLTEPIDAFYKLQFLDPIDTMHETASGSGSGAVRDGFSYYMQTLDVTIGRRVPKRDREKGKGKDPDKDNAKVEVEIEKQELAGEDKDKVVKQEGLESVGIDEEEDHEAKFGKQFEDLVRLGLVDPIEPDEADVDVDVKQEPVEVVGESSSVPPVQSVKPTVKQEQAEEGDTPALPITEASPTAIPQTPEPLAVEKQEEATEEPSSTEGQVDVDLGALKSVSRLHARIG